MTRLKWMSAAVIGGAIAVGSPLLHAVEPARATGDTPYYEEDTALDLTEWFDGNNYNPTDEAWWRIDDESYDAAADFGVDADNDGWYGFTDGDDDDDWYYDYYDPTPYTYYDYDSNEMYDYGSQYFDYDNDGIYDAFSSYIDSDSDGEYENYNYYTLTDSGKQRQRSQSQPLRESRQQTVSGKIQKTKLVSLRGGKKHVVVAIQPQQQPQQQSQQKEQLIIADLGPAAELEKLNPELGDTITVKGPKARVGDKTIVLARSIEADGQTTQVTRDARSLSGKVLDTHTVTLRGQEHLMAMVESTQTQKKRKMAVDFGPINRLTIDINEGNELTFSGFPVKLKDKVLVVAQSVQKGDQIDLINRNPTDPAGQAQPAGGRQQGQQEADRKAQ